MKILLIEDHVPVAEVLRDALRDDGHEVSVAHTGEEGLRELPRQCPNAVFLDLRLPGMDGVAVLRAIRARDPQLPVIVVSGYVTSDEIEQLERLGVHGVIQKSEILTRYTEALDRLSGDRWDEDHGR